jgi:hypothetical protein
VRLPEDDPIHTKLGPQERTLFLTLWGILILVGLLWKFYPTLHWREPDSTIAVELGEELHGRITTATVAASSPSQHLLSLHINDDYRRKLPEDGHRVVLGYDLANEKRVLFTGAVTLDVGRGESDPPLVLPNPERVYTRRIRLYFAP